MANGAHQLTNGKVSTTDNMRQYIYYQFGIAKDIRSNFCFQWHSYLYWQSFQQVPVSTR